MAEIKIRDIEAIKYCGVGLSRTSISSVYGARVNFTIPRDQVMELVLQRGYPGERRWLQLGMGAILLGWAATRLPMLFAWLANTADRVESATVFVYPAALVGLAGWLVWDALRKSWYLEVRTQEKNRKIPFDRQMDAGSLETFVTFASMFGYPLDSTRLPHS